MCGRFTLTAKAERLHEVFPLYTIPTYRPRYNIAPTQMVLAVRQTREDAPPEVVTLKWGLLPSWAKDQKIAASLINARADGVADKPSFRAAFKRRRCLVLADGFYEWKKGEQDSSPSVIRGRGQGEGARPKKSTKQPYHIRMKDFRPFAFAGLWEYWKGDGSEAPIESCTIITTDANDTLRPLHDRMPVILKPDDCARWLDPQPRDPAEWLELLKPYAAEAMTAFPVSSYVGNSRHEGPECLELKRQDPQRT